jgi:hypothetical protein
MKNLIAFTLFLPFAFASCKNETADVYFLDQQLALPQKLEQLLSPVHLDSLHIDSSAQRVLISFYKQRNFQPLWSTESGLTNQGRLIQELLKNPIAFGLPGKRYQIADWDSIYVLKNEVRITALLAAMPADLKNGFFDVMNSLMMKNMNAKLLDGIMAGHKLYIETGTIVNEKTKLDTSIVKKVN